MFSPGNLVPLLTEKSKHKAKKCDKNEQNGAVILVVSWKLEKDGFKNLQGQV